MRDGLFLFCLLLVFWGGWLIGVNSCDDGAPSLRARVERF